MPAWTQQVSISWRPPLVSFFEQRTAILRELQDANLLRRFDVGEKRVGVKVKDSLHHLIFTPEHIEVAALRPDADLEALVVLLDASGRGCGRPRWRRVDPAFRFLTPADQSYDEARRHAGNRLTTWPADAGLQNVDFAVVFDLALEEPKSEIRVESGIVETLFPLKSLPEVGVYGHQTWQIADFDLETQDDVFDLWSRARERAEQIDVAISERLLGDAK